MKTALALSLSAVAFATVPASAVSLASDDYTIGTDKSAGEYTAGAIGTAGAQAGLVTPGFATGGYTSGTGTSQFAATTNGLEYAPLNEFSGTSGKVNYNAAPLDNIIRTNARNLSGVGAQSTFWISHIVNRGNKNTNGTAAGFALTGYGNTVSPVSGATSGFLEGFYVGVASDGTGDDFGSLVIRSRNTAAQTAQDTVLIDGASDSTFGETNAVVMRVDANVAGGSADQVTWYLNPTNFTSELTLAATSEATGSFASFGAGAGGTFARLNYTAQNWDGNVFFDGARLSSDLAGLGGVIPEPATAAVLALGGLALLGRRRTA